MFKKILLVLVLLGLASTARADRGVNIFAYPRPAPEIDIYSQYGQAFKLKNFAGDFLIVVFWSKTCIPCLRELDNLNEFVLKTKDTGIKVILVSPAEDWANDEEQKAFLKRYGALNIDFFNDRKSALASNFGIFTSPHAVLINSKSMEIGRIRGAVEWDDDDVIEKIYQIKAQN